jgi:glycosyltransferase involved in cell wall biosynthesis
MHILLIHQAFASLNEPGGTRHHEMARFLAGRGHQVTIITSRISYLTGAQSGAVQSAHGTQDDEIQPGVKILRTYTYPALHRSFFHRLISFFSFMVSSFAAGIHVGPVDLVWGTSPPIFQGLTALALARIKRVPYLFEVRDLWPAFAVAVGVLRQPMLIRASEWLERFLYRHADLVIVNSPGFIAHVKAGGAQRVELVPNGADPGMFDAFSSGTDFRRDHGLEGKFVALYAGAHGMSNDLEVLLDAAARLQEKPEVAIVLLGAGKDKQSIFHLAGEMGLSNVSFIPPVPKLEMVHALAAADACIAILKPVDMYKLVYPNKVFDYMAAGRPVVLAIDGVIREVIESARAGIFVQPGNASALAEAICRLADNPELGREMGLRGRQEVETRFNRAILSEKLAILMEALVRPEQSGP